MNMISAIQKTAQTTTPARNQPHASTSDAAASPEFAEAFNKFVGETLYGSMLKSMRTTVGKAPYFNGGQAEKIFTQQLDQVLADKLTKTSAQKFSQPMLELYQLQRM